MTYLSVSSGIEAATVAWHPLGFDAVAFSEIDQFPSAVLAQRWPETPNLGDMTLFEEWNIDRPIDVFVGGTPCQSFSVAGLRRGLDDPRGSLMLVYLAIARRYRPRWIVWENVPGVLSSNGGRDFGTFLGGMGQLGYGFAYRVLDAQWFGVPQRRRRVFVVGYLGDWRRAAAVLFERESLRGDSAPSRKKGARIAALTANGVGTCGADDNQAQAGHLIASEYVPEIVQQAMSAKWSKGTAGPAGDEHHNLIAHCADVAPTITSAGPPYDRTGNERVEADALVTHSLRARHDSSEDGTGRGTPIVPTYANVRRITPREAERLQGFPDNYTAITYRGKQAPDGPRYKALGNSMAVPVMRWIGERIAKVDGYGRT